MTGYLLLYVAITLFIIGSGIWLIIWLRKKVAPWSDDTGGFVVVDRFVIDFRWHVVVFKYRNKYYMIAFSDKDLRLIDTWGEGEKKEGMDFKEVLGE